MPQESEYFLSHYVGGAEWAGAVAAGIYLELHHWMLYEGKAKRQYWGVPGFLGFTPGAAWYILAAGIVWLIQGPPNDFSRYFAALYSSKYESSWPTGVGGIPDSPPKWMPIARSCSIAAS